MGLTKLSIERPLTMLMIILAIVVMGYQGYTRLLVDRFPAIDFPVVSVVTTFPGASPQDVADLIVKPIEDAVASTAGIDTLTSSANEGVGSVTVQFLEGVDGNQAAVDVERQVAAVRGQLPNEAGDPVVIKADINAIPIIEMVLSGPQGQDALFVLADDEIKTRLQAIQGVASVNVSGGREREIQVHVDPAKLEAYSITLDQVQGALGSSNVTFPSGSLEEGRQKISFRSVGEFAGLQEIENVVVVDRSNKNSAGGQNAGGLVYLRDVATVQDDLAEQTQFLRYNGLDTVNISVVKSSDANAIETADEVIKAVEEFNEELPAGAEMTIIIDSSEFTRESIFAVQEDLILAILITGIIMLIFLHTIRSTFIVLLAIPTSLMGTFLVMWMLDFSLNMLTLMALVLVIGVLVDDSIVVLENIERHLKMKKKPTQAALEGRSEIGLAAITITLVDVAVYLPVAFVSGIIGQFFFSYGVTIAVAVLFSLFVSFTLTPMLASKWLKDESAPETEPQGLSKFFSVLFSPIDWVWKRFIIAWEAGFDRLANFYARVVAWSLKNFATQSLVLLVAALATAAGIYLVVGGFVGSEFAPQEDDGQIAISIEMPPGTNLETTNRAAAQIEQIVLNEVPEALTILTNGGGGGGGNIFGGSSGSNTANLTVKLTDKEHRERSTSDIVTALRPLVNNIPEAETSISLASSIGGGGGSSAVQIQVFGPDPDVLIDLADQVEAAFRTVPGTVDISNTDAARSPEGQFIVNRDLAVDLGLSPAQIAGTLRTAMSGSDVGKYKPQDGSNEIDIVLRANEEARSSSTELLQLPIGYRQNQSLTLDQVTTLDRSQAPARITRSNRQQVLTVGSGIEGRTSGEVANDVVSAVELQVDFPSGYGFTLTGAAEQQQDSFAQLISAIGLSILLIYMLLVGLYQNWLHPLAIMFSLPVALVGAFGGLYLTGQNLSIFAFLGIILLIGLVIKNAVLLVDFTNILRFEQGYERKAALVEAGRLRLRPIMMTTIVIICAMLPVLLGSGAGSESRQPLAAVVVGGNITSSLLTLILIPVVYNILDGMGGGFSRVMGKLFGSKQIDTAPQLASQPGAAISLNPPASEAGADATA